MSNTTDKKVDLPVVTKNVKHIFTELELSGLGQTLARAFSEKRGIELEFDQVKQTYKAKVAEADAKIGGLSTDLVNRFTMRNLECYVAFRPKDRKKDFYVKDSVDSVLASQEVDFGQAIVRQLVDVACTEDMTKEDFQTELLIAEAKFDKRCEVDLFPASNGDYGVLVIGTFAGKWYTALRFKIGKANLEERLNSEQKAFKVRADAVRKAVKRAGEWLKDQFGDNAKGFEEPMAKALAAQVERVE